MRTQKNSQTSPGASGEAASHVKALIAGLDRAADRARSIDAEISSLLSNLAGRLETQTMYLAFMGRFSSGKSSLINCALGRSLLPTDDLPETGIPCHIGQGYEDKVVVTTRDGALRTLPCTTEAIAEFVSLRTRDGAVNTLVDEVERIDISLRQFAHEDAVWIDAPGIDSGNESLLSEVVSYNADLVVWVLGSEQFLSKSEARGIADHFARCGPESIAIVLNVRLRGHDAPGQEAWQQAVARLPEWRKRMTDMWTEVGLDPTWSPPLILVSAKEALHDPRAFGGPELQNLLTSVRAPTSASSTTLRVGRAYYEVGLAKNTVLEMLVAQQQTNAERVATLAEFERAADLERKRAERQVKDELAAFGKGFSARARTVAEQFCDEIKSYKISRTQDLSDMLRQRLEKGVRDHRKALAAAIEEIEGISSPSEIDQVLSVTDVTVKYANNPIESAAGSTGAGAVIGGVIGQIAIPIPGLGAAVGATIGGLFGNSRGQDKARAASIALDVRQTCEAVTAQADRVAAKMKKAADELIEPVMRSYCMNTIPPAGPDEDREADLVSLLDELNGLVSRLATTRKGRSTSGKTPSR